ncbi:hypothetical protein K466DRAFT_600997 [Polyporus arcularius HHB13444]|uniref:Uncharacterized protein n=1 Tax=Polyporus arcularius HHB13444 TaxID=1314778 RepID=A0A5C3PAG5_9APHY|nr:hypothetical protein K466DRAFT_600997 [Polyporus arcularius HHB13444]
MASGSESYAQRYPEDAYLFEIDDDPDPSVESGLPWTFTERAKRAQAAKWDRLYKLFHPRPVIGEEETGFRCLLNGPRLAYGWAFSRADLLKYAEFHKLRMPLQEYLSGKLGKTHVRYGALSETDAQDEELLFFLDKCAYLAVRTHLEQEAGVDLLHVRPFSKVHDVLFSFYTNIEADERIDEIDAITGLDDATDLIQYAIRDADIQSELLWWYDRSELRGVGLNYPC